MQNDDVDQVVTGDVWEVRSNASRFGVKGEDELTANLSAVYQIEWEVGASGNADSNGAELSARNRFVGVKHTSFGTLKLGKIDTYFKQAELKVDQFNDLKYGDFENILGAQSGPARANNVIDYSSPKLGEVATINLQLIQNEGVDFGNTVPANQRDNGLADGISTSVVFNVGGLNAAVAYNKDVVTRFADSGGNGFKADGYRVAANYTLEGLGLTFGALYQAIETSDIAAPDTEEDGFLISAALKFAEDWTAKAQYGQSNTDNARTGAGALKAANDRDVDRTQYSLGLDYAFTKSTKAYGFYTLLNRDAATDIDTTSYGLGLEHNF